MLVFSNCQTLYKESTCMFHRVFLFFNYLKFVSSVTLTHRMRNIYFIAYFYSQKEMLGSNMGAANGWNRFFPLTSCRTCCTFATSKFLKTAIPETFASYCSKIREFKQNIFSYICILRKSRSKKTSAVKYMVYFICWHR